MRRESAPRLLLRKLSGSVGLSILPADAAGAQRPDPRATTRWVEISTRLCNANFRNQVFVYNITMTFGLPDVVPWKAVFT